MSNVANIAFIRAKARQSEDLGRRLLALVEPSCNEPGCINHDLRRSAGFEGDLDLRRFAMISVPATWRI